MSPSLRDRGRRGHRAGEEEFVLYLQGIPAHCRWQELKDFVRQTALHIRQAVVYDDQYGYPTGLGQIIVKNEDEAMRTFRKLSTTGWDGQPLTITLARATSPTEPIAGPTRSPSTTTPGVVQGEKFGRKYMSKTPGVSEAKSLRAHPIPSTTAYPHFIPPPSYSPTSNGLGHAYFKPIDPGFHSSVWHPSAEALNFSPTNIPLFSPMVDHMEYPSYYPYAHPMRVQMLQPGMYTEANYHENFQQYSPPYFSRPSTSESTTPATSNPYYQQQGYESCNYDSQKNNSPTSFSNIYQNTISELYTSINSLQRQAISLQITATNHIIIDNIGPGVDVQTLKDHFHGAGYMIHCKIIRSKNNENGIRYNEDNYPGQYYAMATFLTPREAENAVTMYNGSILAGSRVVVRLDTERGISTEDLTTTASRGSGSDGGWSGQQSFATSSPPPTSTVTSTGTFLAYSAESPNSQQFTTPSKGQQYPHNQSRRDSGKELVRSIHNHNHSPPRSECVVEDEYKISPNSSRSVSPKSSAGVAKAVSMQPFVVNGSLTGKARM